MSAYEELRMLAAAADKRGDRATAIAAMQKMSAMQGAAQAPTPPPQRGAPQGNLPIGLAEGAASAVTGAIGIGAGAIRGLAAAPFVGFDRGREISREVAERVTYQPRTIEGQAVNAGLGAVVEPLARAITAPERFAQKIPDEYGGKQIAGAIGLVTDAATTVLPTVKGARAANPYVGIEGAKSARNERGVKVPTVNSREVTPQLRGTVAAKEVVEQAGGIPSKSKFASTIKSGVERNIEKLEADADVAFAAAREKMPESSPVPIRNLRAYLDKRIERVGGDPSKLNAADKDLFAKLGDEVPTYGRLDDLRQAIGAKDATAANPYGNMKSGERKQIYKAMRADQIEAAKAYGAADSLESAWNLTTQYKGLQDQAQAMFGRKLDRSIGKRHVKTSATGLAENDAVPFDNFLKSTPEEYRPMARAAVLNEMMRPGKENLLSPKFGQTWESMAPEAKAKLIEGFPPETVAQLDFIAKFSKDMTQTERVSMGTKIKQIAAAHPIMVAAAASDLTGGLLGVPGAVSGVAAIYEVAKYAAERRSNRAKAEAARNLSR